MSKYTEFNYAERYPRVISADNDTIDVMLRDNPVEFHSPTASDLEYAIEWLALYQAYDQDDPHLQAFANVIAFLTLNADTKAYRTAINDKKRAYAEANGVPFNRVRIKKGA